jgi:hypothetical protein
MPGNYNLDAHFNGALHDCFKIIDLEPEQYPVSVRLVITIANRAVIMFNLEAVQLQNKLPIRDELFVGGAAVIAPAAQQTLVPSTACFHIAYGDQGLRSHAVSVSNPTDSSLPGGCARYSGLRRRQDMSIHYIEHGVLQWVKRCDGAMEAGNIIMLSSIWIVDVGSACGA